MGHAAGTGELLHIGVAGAVQRKVTDEADGIGQHRVAVACRLHHTPGTVKEHPAGFVVHGIAQRTHGVGAGCMIIKQQVRPVQADIVKFTVHFQLHPHFVRQMFQNIGTKAAVRVG